MKPTLLDLFCCQGGAAMGYAAAGFRVVGVDIEPQPRYPFAFVQADALSFDLSHYDAIHASPPCQRFSDLAKRNDNADDWPDLIAPIRKRLEVAGVPWVIENVEGAPLREPVILCGTMFRGLRVLRHRLFESNVALVAPPHGKHPLVFTHDKRKAHYGKLDQDTSFVQVTGGGNATIGNKRDAMGGLDWMDNQRRQRGHPAGVHGVPGVPAPGSRDAQPEGGCVTTEDRSECSTCHEFKGWSSWLEKYVNYRQSNLNLDLAWERFLAGADPYEGAE